MNAKCFILLFINLIIIKLKIVEGAYSYGVKEPERHFITNLTKILNNKFYNFDKTDGSGDISTEEPTEATSSTNEPLFGVCFTNDDCNSPFGECIDDENGSYCSCIATMSGKYCYDAWLLVVIVVCSVVVFTIIVSAFIYCLHHRTINRNEEEYPLELHSSTQI